MSTTTKIGAAALALLTLAPVTAMAGSVDDRQTYQLGKIERGRENGSITWREGLKLRAEQRRIAHAEADLSSKGYLTRSERRTLNRMQNKAANHIAEETYDAKERPSWLPRVGR